MRTNGAAILVWAILLAGGATTQTLPDGIYYKFDGGGASTANLAVPGVGLNPAPVNGHTQGGAGQFGGALQGIGGSSTMNFVDTGWPTALGTGDWTISFWLDISGVATPNPFMYMFGDEIVSSFRIFTNGTAGAGNIILRGVAGGPLNEVILPGGAPATAPAVCAWVYDSTGPEIRGYVDGVRVATVPQGALSIMSAGNLKVGGYNTFDGLAAGGLMDEFRLYFRALSDQEIADTWDQEFAADCTINAPAAGSTVSATVLVDYDASHGMSLSLTATFEFSTDMGMSWLPAAAGGASVNPRTGIATPAAGLVFEWDTITDQLGLMTPQSVDFRITVVDPMMVAGSCALALMIDNTALCAGICGDCDLNLAGPNILDALAAAQIAAGLFVPTAAQERCCDVNASMTVDILDALSIAQSAAGLPVTLMCP